MKAIVISGSERKNGITSSVSKRICTLLDVNRVQCEIFFLNEMNYTPCDGCGKCDKDCNYRDTPCEKNDDVSHIVSSMISSDIIIFCCPVHAFGMSHLMQTFLERAGVGYLRFERPLVNKIGGIVVVGRKYSLGSVHDQMVNNMLLNRMIIPGAGFPVLIHGDEDARDIIEPEEFVALEQMVQRVIDVSLSFHTGSVIPKKENERILKDKYVKHPRK